jgi:hypothetical protein
MSARLAQDLHYYFQVPTARVLRLSCLPVTHFA